MASSGSHASLKRKTVVAYIDDIAGIDIILRIEVIADNRI